MRDLNVLLVKSRISLKYIAAEFFFSARDPAFCEVRGDSWPFVAPSRFFLHSYGNSSSFLRIRAGVVEAFVAFREESWLFVVRFSYGLVTISVRFGHD